MTTKKFEATNLLNIPRILDWIITMIREFFARLRTRAKEVAEAGIAKIGAAIAKVMPTAPANAGIARLIVHIRIANALVAGKQYRLTSGHAPNFSLYTFFANRQ